MIQARMQNLQKKYNLPFPLLSDTDGKVADAYGAADKFGHY